MILFRVFDEGKLAEEAEWSLFGYGVIDQVIRGELGTVPIREAHLEENLSHYRRASWWRRGSASGGRLTRYYEFLFEAHISNGTVVRCVLVEVASAAVMYDGNATGFHKWQRAERCASIDRYSKLPVKLGDCLTSEPVCASSGGA